MRNAERGMRNANGRRGAGLGACLLLLWPAAVRAQPAEVVATATADRAAVTLSEAVRVTLVLEGPAPLRVALPERLLADDANELWRIRAAGAAEVTPLPGGRARWRQVYRLDPWTPPELLGTSQQIAFNPVTVNGRATTWPAVTVTVERAGGKAAPPLPEARPITAIESLPPPDDPPPGAARGWVPATVVGVLACAALLAVLVSRRRAKPVPPDEWARAELAAPGADGERVAAVLRAFVARRFGIPAAALTTAELLAAAAEQRWPVEEAEALRAVLDECDRAKFAGHAPDDDGRRRLVAAAVKWVDDVSRPAGPR